jgi:hypothetical protein
MPGKEIDRSRATSALEVIRQHPVLVLFVLSPVIAILGLMWYFVGAGWTIFAAILLLLGGTAAIVLKR